MRRGLPNPRRVIDGAGYRRRHDDWLAKMELERTEAKARELFEERLSKLAAPVLATVADIERVAQTTYPEFPIYGVSRDLSVRDVGRALFGSEGYNRVARRTDAVNVGPHFDDYRGFYPWIIHRTDRRSATIRANFLSPKVWNAYCKLAGQDEVRRQGRDCQNERAIRGEAYMQTLSEVYTMPLEEGSIALIWQSDGTSKGAPPSVHEVTRFGSGDYTIYAAQRFGDIPVGFVEV